MREWDIQIYRGVLTGCNDAFIIDGATKDKLIASDPKSADIIRPILRGRDIKRYGYNFADQWLIAAHNGLPNKNIKRVDINKYPAVKKYLDGFSNKIAERYDKGDTQYNLRSCAYWNDFSKPKIVWADVMRISKNENEQFPRFAMVEDTCFILNSCYLITGERLPFLISVLNSEMCIFQCFTRIISFDDGGIRMRSQYIEQIPIPQNGRDIETKIVTLYNKTQDKNSPEFRKAINEAVYSLYGLNASEKAYIHEFNKYRFSLINNR